MTPEYARFAGGGGAGGRAAAPRAGSRAGRGSRAGPGAKVAATSALLSLAKNATPTGEPLAAGTGMDAAWVAAERSNGVGRSYESTAPPGAASRAEAVTSKIGAVGGHGHVGYGAVRGRDQEGGRRGRGNCASNGAAREYSEYKAAAGRGRLGGCTLWCRWPRTRPRRWRSGGGEEESRGRGAGQGGGQDVKGGGQGVL